MKSIYDSRQRLKFVFIFTAILIAIASLVVSDMLIKDLAQEERQKMEVWAEATRLTASKNTAVDLSLVLKILEGNTTIPVVLCNDKDSIMFVKNISFPEICKGAEKQKYDCDRYGGWNFPICLL